MLHRRIAVGCLLSVLLFAGALAAPAAAAAGKPAENPSLLLELKVKMTLLEKLGVDALHVDVGSEGGRILLTGTVEKRATAELAEEVTRSVAGVSRVKNSLEVAEYETSTDKVGTATTEAEREVKDSLLELKVRAALVDQMGSDGFRIGTDAASGVVSLEFPAGFAPARRDQALALARRVSGVERVIELARQ